MVPEYQRIVRAIEKNIETDKKSQPGLTVRPSTASDRLFLLNLSTQCVPFMFHERRHEELANVRRRFFDIYAGLDLGEEQSAIQAWVALSDDGQPAGAILVQTDAQRALDGTWDAYIYDISVLPEYWGSRVGVSLVENLIAELSQRGDVGYLCGDVSTQNHRAMGLAARFGFFVESRRFFQTL